MFENDSESKGERDEVDNDGVDGKGLSSRRNVKKSMLDPLFPLV